MDKKVCLITGANGFIGSYLYSMMSELYIQGLYPYVPRGSVRNNTIKYNYQTRNPEFIEVGDICGDVNWTPILLDVDTVVHTVARVHNSKDKVSLTLDDYRDVNVRSAVSLAKKCVELGVRRFIFISSIGVNGDQTFDMPFKEDDLPNPKTFYAISKLEAENELKKIFLGTTTELVIIRPPAVYGFNPPGNFGKLFKIVKLGSPLPFGLIRNKRSFVSLYNLCNFIIECSQHPMAKNQIFLVSDGDDVSIADMLTIIGNLIHKPVTLLKVPKLVLSVIFYLSGKKEMSKQIFGDLQIEINKSRTLLNWTPPLSLEDGLKKALNIFE